jgi:hypothetical protein
MAERVPPLGAVRHHPAGPPAPSPAHGNPPPLTTEVFHPQLEALPTVAVRREEQHRDDCAARRSTEHERALLKTVLAPSPTLSDHAELFLTVFYGVGGLENRRTR